MTWAETVTATAAYRDRCEDRIAVFGDDRRTIIVVADGAGGVGSGDLAAESVISEVKANYGLIHSADEWSRLLKQIDFQISVGESTAAVVDLRPYGIAGASVGDSQAWIVSDGKVIDLTHRQNRKPLLGSKASIPVAFTHETLEGILLVASDGFCNYAKRDDVIRLVSQTEFWGLARSCLQLVRLPSGEFWDDVGIVAARVRRPAQTRKRYSI